VKRDGRDKSGATAMVLERMMELVRERARVRALRSADPATGSG
jgi:hypothetical protein